MKGFIIYEDFITNVKSIVNCGRLSPSCYTCRLGTNDLPEASVSGGLLETTTAICKGNDKYDFEVGALIALMKMCGVDKVVRACNEAFSEDTFKTYAIKYERELNELKKEKHRLEEEYIKLREEYDNSYIENEKLQHDYDLCKNSENALKGTVDYLNKSIAKLNTAIYGYKEDLNKVTKRCTELEAKESILNKQEKTIKKREEEMSVYFGGRGCGKQHKALVELFKKLDQKKTGRKIVNWEDVR